MTQPRLLLSLHDRALETEFLNSAKVARFAIDRNDSASPWIDILVAGNHDLAIVQVDAFSESDLEALRASDLHCSVDIIFVSNGAPNPLIDKAMLNGVSYHLRMPIEFTFVEELLEEIYNELAAGIETTEKAVASELDQFGLLVGSSQAMRKLYRVIRKAADADANVLIAGESGSGKELVANTVHLMSPRCEHPFVALNCGAISPELIDSELFGHVKGAFTGANCDRAGVFEQAEGGTLFLDEVTEMPIDHQVKLLRVLECGEYKAVGSDKIKRANVRIISATNRDPLQAIRENLLREDLYFRLAHFPVRVPPLRDRGNDIVGLAKHFLAYRNNEDQQAKEISAEALQKITDYHWPGNVRELKHAIERSFILADRVISEDHVVLESTIEKEPRDPTLPAGIPLDEVERGVILKTLAENNGNKTETANQLGISLKTLYNKLEKYAPAEE